KPPADRPRRISHLSVDLAAMPNCQQMYYPSWHIEHIDDSIVTNPETIPIAADKMVVRETGKPQPHLVNLGLNPCPNRWWEFKERGVKRHVADLERRAHLKAQGLRTRGRTPEFISRSDCWIADSNSGVNSILSSTKSSSQSRTRCSSATESFCSS